MNNKYLILTAQAVSLAFSPFYLPLVAFLVLFFFSYLSYTSLPYSLGIIAMVYVFTILVPRLGIYLYRKVNGWTSHQLGRKERRYVPYAISIASYATLLYIMDNLRMPRFTLGIVAGALSIQVVCALINPWIKISTHSAASGGFIGALIAFSFMLGFDPTFWLCVCIVLAGMVSTARLILRQHTLLELGLGTVVGIICGFLCLLLV